MHLPTEHGRHRQTKVINVLQHMSITSFPSQQRSLEDLLPTVILQQMGHYFITLKIWVRGCWSNIGLLLCTLWVVVCFHSRCLTICKHSCVSHISWAFHSAISGKQTMFTNHKVCLPLIAERNAHEICLTQECLQIVRHLLWKQTTTHSLRNNNEMFDGNLWPNSFVELSIILLLLFTTISNQSHIFFS